MDMACDLARVEDTNEYQVPDSFGSSSSARHLCSKFLLCSLSSSVHASQGPVAPLTIAVPTLLFCTIRRWLCSQPILFSPPLSSASLLLLSTSMAIGHLAVGKTAQPCL